MSSAFRLISPVVLDHSSVLLRRPLRSQNDLPPSILPRPRRSTNAHDIHHRYCRRRRLGFRTGLNHAAYLSPHPGALGQDSTSRLYAQLAANLRQCRGQHHYRYYYILATNAGHQAVKLEKAAKDHPILHILAGIFVSEPCTEALSGRCMLI